MKKQNKLPLIHISQFYGMNWFQISTEVGRSRPLSALTALYDNSAFAFLEPAV